MSESDRDKPLYKTKTAVGLTGFKRSKFNQWLANRLIVPAKLPKRSGDRSGFSFNNLVEFLLVDKMITCGINRPVAGLLAREATGQYVWFSTANLEGSDKHWIIINPEDHAQFTIEKTPLPPGSWGNGVAIIIDILVFIDKVQKYLDEEE